MYRACLYIPVIADFSLELHKIQKLLQETAYVAYKFETLKPLQAFC
jgi:hypothetical protein